MENIVIDDITLIGSGVLMAVAIITSFLNGFFRKPKQLEHTESSADSTAFEENGSPDDAESATAVDEQTAVATEQIAAVTEPTAADAGLPKVSVILTPHENAQELERNLPLYLEQDYPAGFEVIVVAWKGDSDTEDVLKRFAENEHLYSTYIPDSSRYMSRKKLAVTLGVKAAKNEWLLLTDIECRPNSPQWLATMARNCADDKAMVIGYTCYDNETSDYRRFERLHTAYYLMREDQRRTPYRHNGNNLMFRKSMFIDGDGYRGNLKYLRGEYDFMVNKYATRNNTALELGTNAWMVEQEPTDKQWRNKHLFYMENRQHMSRTKRHRLLFNIDQTAMHLNYLLILAALAFSIPTQRWILTGATGVALLTTIILRSVIGKQALRLFDEDISAWKVVPYELGLFWHALSYKWKYMKADKYDFISHKL